MQKTNRPNRRRSRRWHVMWPAVVAHGDQQVPCTILDISELGVKVESLGGLLPKSPATLHCERFGRLDGRLVWTRGMTAGLNFEMSPAEVAKILKPLVPGLDRRDQAAHIVVAKPAPKPKAHFGRKPRAAASAESSSSAELPAENSPVDESKRESAIAAAA